MRTNRLLLFIASALLTTSLLAQAPQGFSYQAVARDQFGNAVGSQPIGVQFVLHQGNALGAVVYAETHGATTNSNGLFALNVGQGSTSTGTFSSIDWSDGPYFLEVAMDVSSSGSYTPLGTQQLMSVPYALYAGRSNVPDGTEVGQILHWDGDEWVADSGLYVADKRFGIGITAPEAPLSIESRDHLYTKFQNGDIPDGQDFRIGTGGNTGLDIDQDTIGGYASRLFIESTTGHIGIGTNEPEAPLAIESREILKTYFETGDIPTQDNFGITTNGDGFGIGQGTPSSLTNRFFIQNSSGNVGVGTIDPEARLHVRGTSGGSGAVVWRVENTASTGNEGWSMGHLHDAITERDGAFGLLESTGGSQAERMVILPSGNVGINESIPDVKLHVSRPLADPFAALDLVEGTGIMVLGPMTDNVAFDYQGLQARHGEYVGPVLNITATTLNLQRLGGNILIHGDDAMAPSNKGIITDDARLGLGTITPVEKIDIDGAIKIGTTTTSNEGTIRFTGTDFEGRQGGSWRSLTTHLNTDGLWQAGPTGGIEYAPPGGGAKVSILPGPTATVRVDSWASVVERSVGMILENTATTTSTDPADNRIGLEIKNSGAWGGDPNSKNIGIYVSNVSGQSSSERNLAAVLNGNVVVGDLTSQQIGAGGANVLAIQNGLAPAASSGAPVSGVQLYSSELSVGGPSVFHVMTGDGSIIKLYRHAAITAADATAVGPVYDPTTAAVIENMRTRINELENVLKAQGLLTP